MGRSLQRRWWWWPFHMHLETGGGCKRWSKSGSAHQWCSNWVCSWIHQSSGPAGSCPSWQRRPARPSWSGKGTRWSKTEKEVPPLLLGSLRGPRRLPLPLPARAGPNTSVLTDPTRPSRGRKGKSAEDWGASVLPNAHFNSLTVVLLYSMQINK